MGSFLGPVGTIGGALLGALVGGVAGSLAGADVGGRLDDTILDKYQCLDCENTF